MPELSPLSIARKEKRKVVQTAVEQAFSGGNKTDLSKHIFWYRAPEMVVSFLNIHHKEKSLCLFVVMLVVCLCSNYILKSRRRIKIYFVLEQSIHQTPYFMCLHFSMNIDEKHLMQIEIMTSCFHCDFGFLCIFRMTKAICHLVSQQHKSAFYLG